MSLQLVSLILHLFVHCLYCDIIMEPLYQKKQNELSQPQLVHYGSNVTFVCKFKLGTSRLNSVKWYKDKNHILTFSPLIEPQIEIFLHENLKIDESKSNMHRLTLCNVTNKHSGNYRCKIITENPNNSTVKDANLTVFAYPERDPIVSIGKRTFNVNEEMIANCSSGKTLPPTTLDWYVNGIKVDKKSIIKEEIKTIGEFYRTLSVVKFKIEIDSDKMILGCVARILNRLPDTRTAVSISVKQSMSNSSERFTWPSNDNLLNNFWYTPIIIIVIKITI